MANNEITFDNTSGISVEEQKEILAKIDGIAERNRQRLALGAGAQEKQAVVKAKKNSAIFPIIINAAALFILCGGALFLVTFNGKKDAQVREGSVTYDLTERALIDEIRKDTAERIAVKESEINSISSRLEDVDAELAQLYSSNQELTAEQKATQERLLAAQNAYRADLAALNEERSKILEDSRSREARLRALLDERAREFAAAQQRSETELGSARDELSRLTSEQEKSAAIDAQLSGGLASISSLIQAGEYDQAAQSAENLRNLNNSSAFSSSRAFQSRREFYGKAIDSMETMISHMRLSGGAEGAKQLVDLQTKNTQLENDIADMKKSIEAFSAGSTGQARRLGELEDSVNTLKAANTTLEANVAEKDKAITTLETEKANLNNTVTELRTVRDEQEQEISNLRSRLSNVMQVLQE